MYLSVLLSGQSKAGKSTLALTAPGPILLLDAERGGGRFTPGNKILWDPQREDIPTDDGTWDVARVRCEDIKTLDLVAQAIESGKHPFKSVVLDSVSELQERIIYAKDPNGKLGYEGWAELLAFVLDTVVRFTDAIDRQEDMSMFVAVVGTNVKAGREILMLQGQVAGRLAYKFDVSGYVEQTHGPEGVRVGMRLAPDERRGIVAGGRGIEAIGSPEVYSSPNLSEMFDAYEKAFG